MINDFNRMLEIERVFLIKKMPGLARLKKAEITQDYLGHGRRLRKAVKADRTIYQITEKLPVSSDSKLEREENNVSLTAGEWRTLRAFAERGLRKTRHYVALPGGLTAELDVFHGPLQGLAWVEVEFPDRAAADTFTPPAWFGRELTSVSWATNSQLAKLKYRDIQAKIAKLA
jgi:CYTH domain-containing protein